MNWKSQFFGIVAGHAAIVLSQVNGSPDLIASAELQSNISLQGALNNIGPYGSAVPGAGNYVVAAPSKVNPDYFYTWTRDSALTLKMIIDEFIFGNESLQCQIDEYIKAQAILQTVTNPSGTFLPDGLGLGEPKYTVNGTRFNGDWGRPQRDGPALRAIALMSYCDYLISNSPLLSFNSTCSTSIWPIISNDLAYITQYWNSTGFDLWEETNGSSFFTIQNQHRALLQGSTLAAKLDVPCPACQEQASQILCFLQSFWNGEFITANLNVDNGRKGIDASTILGPISVFDVDAGCYTNTFQPCEDKSLANFQVFVDTFRGLYPINEGVANTSGVALGRYPEDVYMGGNPWYLITLAAAEFLYDVSAQWSAFNLIEVNNISLPFFQSLLSFIEIGNYSDGAEGDLYFFAILNSAQNLANTFLNTSLQYTPPTGSLSEQFSKTTGLPLSAPHLTWSYTSFLTTFRRSNNQLPPSWGASNASLPSTCTSTSSPLGTYIPATSAGAPNISLAQSCQVEVTFNLNATTYVGENLFLVGDTAELGGWVLGNSVEMGAGGYSGVRPLWSVRWEMDAGERVSYKFVRVEDCGQGAIWEGGNRSLVVGGCGSGGLVVEDVWEGEVGMAGGC